MKTTIPFIILIIISTTFMSCGNKTQQATETEIKTDTIQKEVAEPHTQFKPEKEEEETSSENTLPTEFKSSIRPDEKIKLDTTYTNTVSFLEFNDEGDYWLAIVKKDNDTINLIANDGLNFLKGEEIEINWKIDSLRYAGDPEYLNFKEFLLSAKKLKGIELINNSTKFLWRETLYDEELKTEINTIIINENYVKTISEPEKAALAYAATFIGNECEWDGKANEDRSNLKCNILTALNLGYQCSNTHLEFLQYWFRNNKTILKELENCPTTPNGATIQDTFNEINIEVNGNKIIVFFKAIGFNLRDSKSWNWTEKHFFEFNENELILLNKEISPKEHKTVRMSEN